MAENLRTNNYNDGTPIPEVTDNTAWGNLSTPGYCWYNNDSTLNAKIFGALYNYYVVADTNSLNVCPQGWVVPTDAEWSDLRDFLISNGYGYEGSGTEIAKSMAATFRWMTDSGNGVIGNQLGSNNSRGFSGLPGGLRGDSLFYQLGHSGHWWSSTDV